MIRGDVLYLLLKKEEMKKIRKTKSVRAQRFKRDGYACERGLSLIELAIVMTIASLLMAGLLQTYRIYQRQAQNDFTDARWREARSAIAVYFLEHGAYPCPSHRDLADDHPDYGKSFCPGVGVMAMGECTAGDGFCRVQGREIVGGDPESGGVLIGGLPFKDLRTSLNLSRRNTVDGWGRQFTYAVTERQTNSDTYENGQGAISVFIRRPSSSGTGYTEEEVVAMDQDMNPIPGTEGHVTAVLLSHGADGRGAFTSNGSLYAPCDAARYDGENCNNTGRFNMSLEPVFGGGVHHFDDIVSHSFTVSGGEWTTSTADTLSIYSRQSGNIGIGTDGPGSQFPLDVVGNIKADTNLRTNMLCDEGNNDCFDVDRIGGSGMPCGNTMEVMVGIANGEAVCMVPPLVGVLPNQECDPDEFIVGFESTGEIKCALPPL